MSDGVGAGDIFYWAGRAERAEARVSKLEAERDALRVENERLRALLDMARREQCQCRTCRAIRAALARGEKP